MARTGYTDAQKAEALELYRVHGAAETHRRTGIPLGTIKSWASRNGVATEMPEHLAPANAAMKATVEQRKALLADGLLDDIERLRAQLFAPTVERKAMTVGTGTGTSEIEIAEVHLDQPTFTDQRAIMTSVAIAVDKVQILTGGATENHGVVDVHGKRQRLAQLIDLEAHRKAS